MEKPFDPWNEDKKRVHASGAEAPLYHEREVWFCALGTNIGYEIDGTGSNFDRPVVVIRGFNKNTFFGVALTGRKKEGEFYFYLGQVQERDASANLSQVRLVDSKRLVKKIGMLDEQTFEELKRRLQGVLFGN